MFAYVMEWFRVCPSELAVDGIAKRTFVKIRTEKSDDGGPLFFDSSGVETEFCKSLPSILVPRTPTSPPPTRNAPARKTRGGDSNELAPGGTVEATTKVYSYSFILYARQYINPYPHVLGVRAIAPVDRPEF